MDSIPTSFYNIIDGEVRQSPQATHGTDPVTGQKLWSVPVASSADLDEAVTAAKKAFPAWANTPVQSRKDMISKFQARVLAAEAELTHLLILEGGKPRSVAALELHNVARWFKYHLALDLGEESEELADRTIVTHHTPLGVVAAICPWNFPLVLCIGKVLPALLTGCCVIVKPSPFTPYTTLKLIQMAHDLFPRGVIQALNGGDTLGPAMVAHRDIAKISFTGSIRTGQKIMEQSGRTLKRLTLEL